MILEANRGVFVSVDIETAGPNPSDYALLAIGACLIEDPQRSFYVELKPTSMNATEEALSVSRFSLEELAETGMAPQEAMSRFETWLHAEIRPPHTPVMVGFNAPFDWMFINDYFHRYLGGNPFGHSAIDIKAFFMGLTGTPWEKTTYRHVSAHTKQHRALSHHALHDAQDQARIFKQLLLLRQQDEPPTHLTNDLLEDIQ